MAEQVILEADNVISPDNNTVTASGKVVVSYKDMILTADNITYHKDTKQVEAYGNVVMQDKENYISATELSINIDTKNGILYRGSGFYAPDIYFSAEVINKVGENSFELTDARISSCNQENPDWSFSARKAKIDYGSYFRSTHTTFNIKDMPIFYTPYFVWPIKDKRESGFLVPDIGFSSDTGLFVTPKYFFDLGIDKDATLGLNIFSEKGPMLVSEYRYKGSKSQEAYLYGEVIKDYNSYSNKTLRWRLVNKSNLLINDNLDLTTNIDYVSDFRYKNDFDNYLFKSDKINRSTDENYSVAEARLNYQLKYSNLSLRYIDNMRYYLRENGYNKDHIVRYPQIIAEKVGISKLKIIKLDYYADFNNVKHTNYSYDITKENLSYDESYNRYFAKIKFYKLFDVKFASILPYFTQSFTYWNDISEIYANSKTFQNDFNNISVSDSHAKRAIYNYGLKINLKEIYKNYSSFRHSVYQSLEYSHVPYLKQDELPNYIENDVIEEENYYSYRLLNYLKSSEWGIKLELLQKYDQTKDEQRFAPIEIKGSFDYKNTILVKAENNYNYYSRRSDYFKNNISLKIRNVVLDGEYIYDNTITDYNTSLKYTLSVDINSFSLSIYQKYARNNPAVKFSNLKKQENAFKLMYNSECYSIGAMVKEKFYDVVESDDLNSRNERIIYLLFELKGLGGGKRKVYETNL